MNFLKKMVAKFEDRKYYSYEFDSSKYPDYPEDFKPNIDSIGRIVSLTAEVKKLFCSQLEATPEQRREIQERIMSLNNRIRIFELIRAQQYDVENIQIHYEKLDVEAYYGD